MFGSTILDVAIGLIMVYLLMSLLCSAVREAIESIMKSRASDLERGLRELLHERNETNPNAIGLVAAIYDHPLVASLYQGTYSQHTDGKQKGQVKEGVSLPSYIPAANFALALMDVAARGKTTDASSATAESKPLTLQNVREGIENLGNARVQRALLTALDTAQNDLGQAQRNVEAWFNGSMDRVSGWYKRRTQRILFFVGLAVTIALNVNSIAIATALTRSPALRDAVVAQAQQVVSDTLLRKRLARPRPATPNLPGAAVPSGGAVTDTTAAGPAGGAVTDTTVAGQAGGAAADTTVASAADGSATDTTKAGTAGAAATDTTSRDTAATTDSMLVAQRIKLQTQAIHQLGVPIGWSNGILGPVEGRSGNKTWDGFAVIFGWLLTAFAVMLGAPFWFDVLNKVMVVRSTVKPHEKSPEESSEDRQKGGDGSPPHLGAAARQGQQANGG